MIRVARTVLTLLTVFTVTPLLGTLVIIAGLLGAEDRDGGIFDWLPRAWARSLVWASGATVVVHGGENRRGAQHIFVGNHMSWSDVPLMASLLTRIKFVAKAELRRVPLLGRAMESAGNIFIERENRKSSVASLEKAADRVHSGASVVIFAEGTRGTAYPLRPFKKGPFVLAINSQAPIVPTVIHGAFDVLPRGALLLSPGRIDVHFLEPVPTTGMTYEDRNDLAKTVRDRMAVVLRERYGVESPPWDPRRSTS